MASNTSTIKVETRTTDTDGSELFVKRTSTNLYDVRWDVKDTSYVSCGCYENHASLQFGSLGGIDMTPDQLVKVYEEIKTALKNEDLLPAESVV